MFGLMRVSTHHRLIAEVQVRNQSKAEHAANTIQELRLPPETVKRWTDQGLTVSLTAKDNIVGGRDYRFKVTGNVITCPHCGKKTKRKWMQGD